MELAEIQATIHTIALELRRINDLIKTPKFMLAWDYSSKESRNEVIDLLNSRDMDGLLDWQARHLNTCIAAFPVRDLRALARRLGINPTGLGKGLLLYKIEEAQK